MARLFFALQPPEADRLALARLVPPRVAAAARRPLRPDNLHLTLCFLGETPEAAVARLMTLARPFAGFHAQLSLDRIDFWPRSAVLVALPREDAARLQVISLASSVRAAAREAGFAPDESEFRPHVTLVRSLARARPGEERWPQPLAEPARWRCESLLLMRSDPGPEGPVYRIVRE